MRTPSRESWGSRFATAPSVREDHQNNQVKLTVTENQERFSNGQ